jgi:acetyl esterase/lipase
MPWVFLAVSVVGALLTLNAFRPSSRWQLLGFSFFAAWLTGELVVWHLVWQAAATVVFVALGALDAWPGWLGLAITFASWGGLVVLATVSRRSAAVFEEAVDRALALEPGVRTRVPWRQAALPFYLRDRRVERIKDLSYGPYGKRNRLDVWRPRAAAEDGRPRPVLLQIHGGAWIIGDKGQQGLPLMLQLAAEGWICVATNYRLSPKATWPDHLVDVKRALAWVREHIAEYGGDPTRISVTGGSAGAHLAAMVALTANDPRYQPGFESADTSVRACVPMYGVYDFVEVFRAGGSARAAQMLGRWVMKTTIEEDRAAYVEASPVTHVHADAPPFFVVHGTADNLAPVGQAREFVTRLRAVTREPVAYAEVPRASHAFDVFHSTRTAHAVHAIQRFLAWSEARPAPSAGIRPADGPSKDVSNAAG